MEPQAAVVTGKSTRKEAAARGKGSDKLAPYDVEANSEALITGSEPGEDEPLLQQQEQEFSLMRLLPSSKPPPGQPTWGHFMQTWEIPLILFYYGICSSTLIVINKVAVSHLRAPVFILVLQLLFAAGSVKFLTVLGTLDAEDLQWRLVRPFLLIIVGFLGTVFGECCHMSLPSGGR
jgi:hypothetical protein